MILLVKNSLNDKPGSKIDSSIVFNVRRTVSPLPKQNF